MRNIQKQNTTYSCDVCGHQVSQKKSLVRHKKVVHEGIKYSCMQCNHQATSKRNLVKHQRAVHEGVKYSCGECGKQESSQSILLDTKGQYMKESNTLVCNAEINLIHIQMWLDTNW